MKEKESIIQVCIESIIGQCSIVVVPFGDNTDSDALREFSEKLSSLVEESVMKGFSAALDTVEENGGKVPPHDSVQRG